MVTLCQPKEEPDAQGLDDGTYTYEAHATDGSGNAGSTGQRAITVNPPSFIGTAGNDKFEFIAASPDRQSFRCSTS